MFTAFGNQLQNDVKFKRNLVSKMNLFILFFLNNRCVKVTSTQLDEISCKTARFISHIHLGKNPLKGSGNRGYVLGFQEKNLKKMSVCTFCLSRSNWTKAWRPHFWRFWVTLEVHHCPVASCPVSLCLAKLVPKTAGSKTFSAVLCSSFHTKTQFW